MSSIGRADQSSEKLRAIVVSMRDAGASLKSIAEALNTQGFRARRGKNWTPAGVRNVLIVCNN
ncbi:recombinase family protein [Vibrio comitans]